VHIKKILLDYSVLEVLLFLFFLMFFIPYPSRRTDLKVNNFCRRKLREIDSKVKRRILFMERKYLTFNYQIQMKIEN